MKVRAKQDGIFGGYYRLGPIEGEGQNFAGEIFEIPDGDFPVPECNEMGEQIKDPVTGKLKFKMEKFINPKTGKEEERQKTFRWFSAEWMERVDDDETNTFDHPPFQIPSIYRAKHPAPIKGGKAQPVLASVI